MNEILLMRTEKKLNGHTSRDSSKCYKSQSRLHRSHDSSVIPSLAEAPVCKEFGGERVSYNVDQYDPVEAHEILVDSASVCKVHHP